MNNSDSTTISRYEKFAARARAIETREDRKYNALQKSIVKRTPRGLVKAKKSEFKLAEVTAREQTKVTLNVFFTLAEKDGAGSAFGKSQFDAMWNALAKELDQTGHKIL